MFPGPGDPSSIQRVVWAGVGHSEDGKSEQQKQVLISFEHNSAPPRGRVE
jgi:hypothetical protein